MNPVGSVTLTSLPWESRSLKVAGRKLHCAIYPLRIKDLPLMSAIHVSTGKTLLLHFIQAEAEAILKGEKSKNQLPPDKAPTDVYIIGRYATARLSSSMDASIRITLDYVQGFLPVFLPLIL